MVRTLPEGHFDIDSVDIQGTAMEEVHDDGNNIIAEGQVENKYAALSKVTADRVAAASSHNMAAESHAEVAEAEDVRAASADEHSSSSESEEMDDLSFIRSAGMRAILARDEDAQKGPSALSNKASTVPRTPGPRPPPSVGTSGPKARRQQSAPPVDSALPPKFPRLESAPAAPVAPAVPVRGGAERVEPSGGAQVRSASAPEPSGGRPPAPDPMKKFEGKSPEDILAKYGVEDTVNKFSQVKTILTDEPQFSASRWTPDFDKAFAKVQATIKEAHKSVVNLDIRVRKWTDKPPSVVTYMHDLRKKIKFIPEVCARLLNSQEGRSP